jgi:hypothetical protein
LALAFKPQLHFLKLHSVCLQQAPQPIQLLKAVSLALLQLGEYLSLEVGHVVVDLRHFCFWGRQLLPEFFYAVLS